MANIDVTKIEGYADMTPEDKVAALEAYEYDDGSNLKAAVDKATHEAAEYKKQLKALQDEQKKGDGEASQTIQSLKAQVEQLTRTNTIAEYTSQYLALGYTAEMAKETAEAQFDGDISKVMDNQRIFLEEKEKSIKAELLKQTPRPGQGGTGTPSGGMTKEKFQKLSFAERAKFAAEHPEEYEQFYKS